MLFVSRPTFSWTPPASATVSISESRCFSFQDQLEVDWKLSAFEVSISESRCFSFQVYRLSRSLFEYICFNLGIEMLFVSRKKPAKLSPKNPLVSISESRCFSFQVELSPYDLFRGRIIWSFNLGIEMLFVSRIMCIWRAVRL